MEPEQQPTMPETAPPVPAPDEQEYHGLRWVFIGPSGLRAGWSVAVFLVLTLIFLLLLGTASAKVMKTLHVKLGQLSAGSTILQEGIFFLSLLASATIVSAIERRRILDYNLTGPRRLTHFFSGLGAGFAALSVLVGAMTLGGWLHFGPAALSGAQVFQFAALWAIGFLLVGLCEEGSFRCYLQFTLTRGINFWWALGIEALLCVILLFMGKGNGAWGIYAMALLGVLPCWLLHQSKAHGSGFWQAAWVSSTFFGFIHTGNTGENWIGIFAAAAIGFVFCVSVWATGSAWWAIGCHAAWDWAETYFYGTADSGLAAKGHYLTTTPAGNAMWSGGANGPEGSLLVLPTILLLLVVVLVLYRRGQPAALAAVAREQSAA